MFFIAILNGVPFHGFPSQVSAELLEELKIEKVLGGSVTKIEVPWQLFLWKVGLEI